MISLSRRRRRKIRAYMRGFRELQKHNKTEYVAEIRNELANHPTNGESITQIFDDKIETCYHQFLVYRLIDIDFNKALLSAIVHPNKHFYYPLPPSWREIIRSKGFKTTSLKNDILWFSFNFKWYLIGLITGLLEVFHSEIFKKSRGFKKAAFFQNLYPNNFVQSGNKNSQNIIEWFSEQKEAMDISTIYHNCKNIVNHEVKNKSVQFKRTPFTSINSLLKLIRFCRWLLYNSVNGIFNIQARLLFRQLVFDKITQLSAREELCKYYLFHNSGHLLRPLWTYTAEQKECKIIFYFYSTNISSFKEKEKQFIQDFQWQVVNWPHYWVWNKSQANFLVRNTIALNKTTIKGIIPFKASKQKLNINVNPHQKTLVVFDVQPVKHFLYAGLAPTVDYYSNENTIRFLEWIDALAVQYDLKIFLKRKRYSSLTSKRYLEKVNSLVGKGHWIDLNPELDPNSACNQLKPTASIHIPYTSTAIITKEYNIPSVYLDPSNKLDPTFKINNDIEFLSSKEALFDWFENCI